MTEVETITTRPSLPAPLARDVHKGDAGRVTLLAGSAGDGKRPMPGAAVLCVRGALRGGAGLVTALTLDPRLWSVVATSVPEALLASVDGGEGTVARVAFELERRSDDRARAIGPGLGRGSAVRGLVEAFLRDGTRPLVVDADGLNAFAGRPEDLARRDGAPLVLTPHPGEAARLLERSIEGGAQARREAAVELATRSNGVCVLKGADTVVADAARAWVCELGNPGMATGGAGDVLTGLVTALLAQVGPDGVFDAVRAAVWVHARAGDLAAARVGRRALIASDLVEHLGAAQLELEGDGVG